MNKKLFFSIMLAVVLVCGMTVVGCGDDGGGGPPGGGDGLTITGLGAYNGKYVWAYGLLDDVYDDAITACASIDLPNMKYNLTKIANGSATLKVYNSMSQTFTGSGSAFISICIHETASVGLMERDLSAIETIQKEVNFVQGKASVNAGTNSGGGPINGGGPTLETAFALTENQWVNSSVPTASSAVWYKFNVTNGKTYYVWWNDEARGDDSKTGDVVVRAKYVNDTYVFGSASSDTTVDHGWNDPQQFTANQTGTVYLEVRPYNTSSSYTGTFGIVYSTSSTRPGSSDGNNTGGLTWTAVSYKALGNWNLYDIAWSGSRFVAVGQSGRMAYSADGISWTPVLIGTGNGTTTFGETNIEAITWGGGKFVAAGANGKMAYSADGINWMAVSNSSFGTSTIYAIAYGDNKFVAVGASAKMAYSADGTSWTAIPPGDTNGTSSTFLTDPDSFYGNDINGIAWGGGRFVAVGNNGKMAYSSNGTSWTAVSDSTFTRSEYDVMNDIEAITYGAGKFIAAGNDSKMAYSSNGISWTAGSINIGSASVVGISPTIYSLAYGDGKFVAGSIRGLMAYSENGTSWTRVTDSTFGTENSITENNTVKGIAYGAGRFVAVAGDGQIAYTGTPGNPGNPPGTNKIPIDIPMVKINGGTFTMGSPEDEPGYSREGDRHQVTLTGFYMGKYPVTQAQYEAVMGHNPSSFRPGGTYYAKVAGLNTPDFPVEHVSWYDVIVFCNKLSMKEGLSPAYRIPALGNSTDPAVWGNVPADYRDTETKDKWDTVQMVPGSTGYRLPTEAQWEYACRAGTTTAYNWGTNYIYENRANFDVSHLLSRQDENSLGIGTSLERTSEVGSYAPNAWGLYDMHGNVWERCWDWVGLYPNTAQTDPTGPDTPLAANPHRLRRGGSWMSFGKELRSAYRDFNNNAVRDYHIGFRVVRPDYVGGPAADNPFPIVSDFTVDNMRQDAGAVTAVNITAEVGKSGGTVSNIRYAGSTTVPQTAGTYAVTFDVAAAAGWNAATGLNAGDLIVIPTSTLIENQWASGRVATANSVVKYTFTVTSNTTYRVWWNDIGLGNERYSGDVIVRAKYANTDTYVFGSATTAVDNGWTTPQSFTANKNGTILIEVYPWQQSKGNTGTFGIVYSTGSTRPAEN